MKKILILSLTIGSLYNCSQKKENTFAKDVTVQKQDTIINGLVINNYKDRGRYKTFKNEDNKYGISDAKGNVIVESFYDGLEKRSDFYYMSHQANKPDALVWLDVQNKKLVVLPGYIDHHLNIKGNIDVVVDKNQNMGVLADGKKVLIPFQYESVEKIGNTYFAKQSSKSRVDVFDQNLKKDILPFSLKDAVLLSDKENLITATNDKDKMGIIDSDLKVLVPFEYSIIVAYTHDNHYFIVSKKDAGGKPLFGIMDHQFKIVVPVTYDHIDESDTDEKKLEVTKGIIRKTVDFKDFITGNYIL
ncbi:WG repeat-containing protein [Chryseobacterium sp. SSA4.19]|uniref:WG repeat-containing protein n=1 Tax=Chryseobacterium sp. SSA4.19 TaxID=2919915 RepID=UPI001F4DD1F9|nr:WG repeat-containing protein [Chryseobacterium sp. SSA4.19]MCJ8154063.1 WG repeat-containing protein [Chryseobacterium sp. SSA4.19]